MPMIITAFVVLRLAVGLVGAGVVVVVVVVVVFVSELDPVSQLSQSAFAEAYKNYHSN